MSIRKFTTFGLLFGAITACEPRPADQPAPSGPVIDGVEGEDAARRGPDSTARNQEDRAAGSKTPFDQAESGADIATTAAIRREILRTEGLSTNADNIKIITENGMVTLRGVVNSDAELETVRSIATRIAGSPEKVDVQIEVDPDAAEKEGREGPGRERNQPEGGETPEPGSR